MVAYRALFDLLPGLVGDWLLHSIFLPKLLPAILVRRTIPDNWLSSAYSQPPSKGIPRHLLDLPVHAGGLSEQVWLQLPLGVQRALSDQKACITFAWGYVAENINKTLAENAVQVREAGRDCMRQLYLRLDCAAPTPDMQAMRWPTVGTMHNGSQGALRPPLTRASRVDENSWIVFVFV